MADFREQIEEIKALLSSQKKAVAYPKLLHLQEISAAETSAVETLADSSHAILSFVVADISDNDEEMFVFPYLSLCFTKYLVFVFPLNLMTMFLLSWKKWLGLNLSVIRAAQALKCLGFMIYHPIVVASVGGSFSLLFAISVCVRVCLWSLRPTPGEIH